MQHQLDVQRAAELTVEQDCCEQHTCAAALPPGAGKGWRPVWPTHHPMRMARDFLLWRHLRVVRARFMRHIHKAGTRLTPNCDGKGAVTSYGVRMHPNWHDRTYAYCHYGTYGHYLADILHSLDRPFQFLDIGANQGLFSLIAAQNPACEAVIALEPVTETFAQLQRNFALNRLDRRARALNFGLSDRKGVQLIAKSSVHSGVATLEGHLAASGPDIVHQQVRTETIDGLATYLADDLPIFVKIDVEGHEAVVMSQLMRSGYCNNVVGLFYEFDARWCDGGAIERVLREAEFVVARQYGRGKHFDALAIPKI